MRHYCTLFDRNYLDKGLALHASLLKHSSEPFTLWILAMDNETAAILDEMELPNVKVLPLSMFEHDMGMAPVKASRSRLEYLWTCASSLCEYLLSRYPVDMLTYLDADLFFFADPASVFNEIGDRSIAIIPHRFAPADRPRLEPNGIFNVGWVTFRNDAYGSMCAKEWAADCREWCHNKKDPERFGDQKYLDSWPEKFGDYLAVIENIGANVAPWNLQQYAVGEGPKVDGSPVVFYHMHEYRNENDFTRWPLRGEDIWYVYMPYVMALRAAAVQIESARKAMTERSLELQAQGERA